MHRGDPALTPTCGCTCPCLVHQYRDATTIPVAYLVARDGVELAVCTGCVWPGDVYLARLVDGETDLTPFVREDPMGAWALRGLIDDDAWADWQARTPDERI